MVNRYYFFFLSLEDKNIEYIQKTQIGVIITIAKNCQEITEFVKITQNIAGNVRTIHNVKITFKIISIFFFIFDLY